MNPQIPFIPENAPFNSEQRAWLNGFLAGMFARALQQAGMPSAPSAPARPVTILFASQSGNAESLARRMALQLKETGWTPSVFDMAEYPIEQLKEESLLLVIASTYGDGEPPDNARGLWEYLGSPSAPRLAKARFALIALGDSNYPKFCRFGQQLDQRLEELGAQRLTPRVDCDVDFEAPYIEWLKVVRGLIETPAAAEQTEKLAAIEAEASAAPHTLNGTTNGAGIKETAPVAYSRKNPFPARFKTSRNLHGPGSTKETTHVELMLGDPGLPYEVGDALAVQPCNCPELVDAILKQQGFSGGEAVPGADGGTKELRAALIEDYEFGKLHKNLLKAIAERSGDESLKQAVESPDAAALQSWIAGRDVLDVLEAYPAVRFDPVEFVALLKKLMPRMYSISSSPKAHPGEVHLTVGVLRFDLHGRMRKGIGSTFLADRASAGNTIPVFIHPGKNFRLPADGNKPVIMVGPGTGIAPFRAFLQERRETGSTGKNWLLFGDRNETTDFLYRDEIAEMREKGVLSRLDLAFSRDANEKCYVQHRMVEQAADLFAWLEEGANFYVCGDASRMAKDVHHALHEVVKVAGGASDEQAQAYVKNLEAQKRYQRDVY